MPTMVDLNRFAQYSDFEAHAREVMSAPSYGYVSTGSESESTLSENERAYKRWVFRKNVLVDVSNIDTTVELLGRRLSTPLLVSPTSVHKIAHPDGELATARVVRDAGSLMILSTLASSSIESVAEVGPNRWFQLYIQRDRGLTQSLLERAHHSGFEALVLTVDTPTIGQRYCDSRNAFQLPDDVTLANLADRKYPTSAGESSLVTYSRTELDATLTWKDLDWFRSVAPLPIVLKGITTGNDAKRALEHGVDAIIVSNHGGRQLDGDPATLDALPRVLDAVDGKIPVLVDGGIRHGSDVLKALALGAKCALVGRAVYYGLACDGEPGFRKLFGILNDGLVRAMQLAGVTSLDEISQDLIEPAPGAADAIAAWLAQGR
jgi:4-hydroxymandelate oxidase